MAQERSYEKRGYLKEPFRLFHLRDTVDEELDYHYHEFDKLVLFLGGSAGYIIEGRAYTLEPWDILLVGRHQIHRPVIDPAEPYERAVLYISRGFLTAADPGGDDLAACFQLAERRHAALLRPDAGQRGELGRLLSRLEGALGDGGFAGGLLARTIFLQLVIAVNRMALAGGGAAEGDAARFDPKIADTLDYINGHLDADLSVDALAGRVYVSKYHFMRRFKALTGCTVHSYVRQKRLLAAAELLRRGTAAQDAGLACGFQDYSAFQRAFRKEFGATPREYG